MASKKAKSTSPAPATEKKERKARATVPENETREDRFKRLMNTRMKKALTVVRLIGNLAGPGYVYTDEQIVKVREALNDAVKLTMDKFTKAARKEIAEFSV